MMRLLHEALARVRKVFLEDSMKNP